MADDAFEDLLAALRWGAELHLTSEQRQGLEALWLQDWWLPAAQHWWMSARSVRNADQRACELEAAMRSKRDEWVFRPRRRKPDASATRR